MEPSALRYITAFEIGDPFLYSYKDASSENTNAHKQLEFAVIKVRITFLGGETMSEIFFSMF